MQALPGARQTRRRPPLEPIFGPLLAALLAAAMGCSPGVSHAPLPAPEPEAPAGTASGPAPAAAIGPVPPPISALASPAAGVATIEIAEIDALVTQALSEGRMPGAVVVVGRRDRVLFQRAYGQRALLPEPAPIAEDTIFDIASLTKPVVTATLIQHLIERGRLNLDDRVARHLPEFAVNDKAAISVRQLLLHTGGLPIVNPLKDYADGPALGLQRVLQVRPESPPGQSYQYGDLNYIVLGALIERVAGEPLDVLAQRVLFSPLGMHDTRFRPGLELRPRIAPTEVAKERPIPLIHGEAHDPRAWLLGGVAGNAGVFTTAADLARFARMLLGNGELDGVRVLSRRSVQELTRAQHLPSAIRTTGWDVASAHSKAKGTLLSPRAYGHGGYTGTSLWVDPELDLFVAFLSNRVHPAPAHSVVALQGAIADAAARAVAPLPTACSSPASPVAYGVDVLASEEFESLRGLRVALVTHRAAIAASGATTLDVLRSAPGVQVVAVLSPEHGFEARAEGPIRDSYDAASELPVYSLYGATLRPTARMLEGVDALVVDLVDVGTRYYTYMSTLQQTLWAGAEHHIPVVVLDRPNPIGGVLVEGPLQDVGYENFVNHHRLPVRHGMTAGELAELMNDERHIGAQLEVVPARGWRRELMHEQTGLPWQDPSPNLRGTDTALLYPAIGLVESTNVSVGRGTEEPFHIIGAPFIDSARFIAALEAARLPGVEFSEVSFVPEAAPHRGQRCQGVRATVTDALAFRPVRTGLVIARTLWQQNRRDWQSHKLIRLVGNRAVVQATFNGAPLAAIERSWEPELAAFLERRARFARYPACELAASVDAPR